MNFLPKAPRAAIATLALILVLGGCATQAERQFQTMRADNKAAADQFNECTTAVYNDPEISVLRAHLPLKSADATLQQLSDQSYISPTEYNAVSVRHAKNKECRRVFLHYVSLSEPALVPVFISSYNKGDDALIELMQRKVTWGEYVRDGRDRAAASAAALREEHRRVVSGLKQDHEAEMARRQRATEALAAWAQTQQIINAANRPVVTNCTGFGNTVNCVSR